MFALDLAKAFDTVSRREILEILPELNSDSHLVALVHGLHHGSCYRLSEQGEQCSVETTTGIKQGCKLAPSLFSLLAGRLYKDLAAVFGEKRVRDYFTGYADDLTIHRTIRSKSDLDKCHKLIRQLLESLKEHQLFRNHTS